MIICKFDGKVSTAVDDRLRPVEDQFRHVLGQLDGDAHFAYLIYYVPDPDRWLYGDGYRDSEYQLEYLQAGGAAEAMTVEVRRRETDDEYHQYVLGRPGDDPTQPDVWIPIAEHGQSRRPSEVFTADTATPIFYHYFQTRTVPDGVTLRELDLRWPPES